MRQWMFAVLVLVLIPCGGGEAGVQEGQGDAGTACALLESTVPDLFGADPERVTFRPSGFRRQDICRARWASSEEANNRNEVRLTILGTVYDTAEEAVASLESTVATGGTGEWVEGVGDRAFQNETSVQVAAKARRFTVSVSIADDSAGNQERTLELARKLVERM